ncbi:MAG: Dam family site-specific DNA-(adenine-N6)-methyltransferase [Anaerolineales bacterium]|nr:Dam family site-specific DNA-(adenine-N6)-methyltransferase [Anaerolineales bacterium]
MNKVHVPPIKCQGIKTKLVDWIDSVIHWNNEGTWIEPFVGSGVVGFNMLPKQALFGDSNPHIIRFYEAIQRGEITPQNTRQFLEKEGTILKKAGEAHYYYIRERFNQSHDPLDFLFLNRSCFNGVIRFNQKGAFNVPFGHKPERFAPAYVTKIVNQVAFVADCTKTFQWKFVCQDFRETIALASSKDLIYCDPPYLGRHVDYFNTWDEAQELKLYKALKKSPNRFILSTWHSNAYRKNPYIETLWQEFFILTREHFYHVGAQETNRNPMLEALIMNYRPPISEIYRPQNGFQYSLFEPHNSYTVQATDDLP